MSVRSMGADPTEVADAIILSLVSPSATAQHRSEPATREHTPAIRLSPVGVGTSSLPTDSPIASLSPKNRSEASCSRAHGAVETTHELCASAKCVVLPVDLIRSMLSFLTLRDLMSVQPVCRLWSSACDLFLSPRARVFLRTDEYVAISWRVELAMPAPITAIGFDPETAKFFCATGSHRDDTVLFGHDFANRTRSMDDIGLATPPAETRFEGHTLVVETTTEGESAVLNCRTLQSQPLPQHIIRYASSPSHNVVALFSATSCRITVSAALLEAVGAAHGFRCESDVPIPTMTFRVRPPSPCNSFASLEDVWVSDAALVFGMSAHVPNAPIRLFALTLAELVSPMASHSPLGFPTEPAVDWEESPASGASSPVADQHQRRARPQGSNVAFRRLPDFSSACGPVVSDGAARSASNSAPSNAPLASAPTGWGWSAIGGAHGHAGTRALAPSRSNAVLDGSRWFHLEAKSWTLISCRLDDSSLSWTVAPVVPHGRHPQSLTASATCLALHVAVSQQVLAASLRMGEDFWCSLFACDGSMIRNILAAGPVHVAVHPSDPLLVTAPATTSRTHGGGEVYQHPLVEAVESGVGRLVTFRPVVSAFGVRGKERERERWKLLLQGHVGEATIWIVSAGVALALLWTASALVYNGWWLYLQELFSHW